MSDDESMEVKVHVYDTFLKAPTNSPNQQPLTIDTCSLDVDCLVLPSRFPVHLKLRDPSPCRPRSPLFSPSFSPAIQVDLEVVFFSMSMCMSDFFSVLTFLHHPTAKKTFKVLVALFAL